MSFRVFPTEPILAALGDRPTILSACFSGRACETGTPKKNLITSCAADETSKQLDMPGGHYQEPVLYWAGQLYCDPKTFEEADTSAPKGELSEVEISYFLAKKMGGKKTVPFVFTSREMNLDPKEMKELVQFAGKPNQTAEFRVIDDSRVKSEAEAKARALTKGKPDLKGSVVQLGTLKEITWKEGEKSQKRLLPGYYTNGFTAGSAVKKLLGSQNPTYTIADVGSVYVVIIEDKSQPCRVTRAGIPQTPNVGGTIKSLTH